MVRPNHSGFTAWLCRQGHPVAAQPFPGAVWTTELRLEPARAIGSEQEGRLCRTWAEQRELMSISMSSRALSKKRGSDSTKELQQSCDSSIVSMCAAKFHRMGQQQQQETLE